MDTCRVQYPVPAKPPQRYRWKHEHVPLHSSLQTAATQQKGPTHPTAHVCFEWKKLCVTQFSVTRVSATLHSEPLSVPVFVYQC